MNRDPFGDDADFRAAATVAAAFHRKTALLAFADSGLAESTIAELIALHVRSPSVLTDSSWTEASMQRELSEAAFREAKSYRDR